MSEKEKLPAPKVPMPDMRRGIKGYFQDVGREMRKVIWPSRAETARLTYVVIAVCVIFVLYLFLFGEVVQLIINGLLGKGGL
jgi:preprotein translocase subunit SecE